MISNEKINSSTYKTVKILVAPLDWGLGHATRCVPVIKELINQQCEVWIAAAGVQRTLLQEEFPSLSFVELPGYEIKYGKNRALTIFRLLCSIPKILIRIKQEKAWLRAFRAAERPDAIISDNRYGLYAPGLCSVFITHQLCIRTPFGKVADGWLRRINYRAIRSFSRCWVPDIEGDRSLAGELSHPARLPDIPTRYIGWLSRFGEELDAYGRGTGEGEIPGSLLVLLSGPEPQRTILEKKILEQAGSYAGRITLVRGLPGEKTRKPDGRPRREGADGPAEWAADLRSASHACGSFPAAGEGLIVYDHLPAKALAPLIREAEVVLSRSGYSTVMDLATLGKRAVLIPTPGQTEQEYLGAYLAGKQWAVCVKQSEFSLTEAVRMARNFPYTWKGGDDGSDLLRREIRSLLEELGGADQSFPDLG